MNLTLEEDGSRVCPLHLDGLVIGPVALQPGLRRRRRCLPADEALLALEHQHGPVHQVEVEPGLVLVAVVAVGEEVAGPLGAQQLAVVGAEGDGPVVAPAQREQGVRTPGRTKTRGKMCLTFCHT